MCRAEMSWRSRWQWRGELPWLGETEGGWTMIKSDRRARMMLGCAMDGDNPGWISFFPAPRHTHSRPYRNNPVHALLPGDYTCSRL
jgi:hypothetical protein